MRFICAAVLVVVSLVGLGPARPALAAQPVSIKAFFGTWAGSAIAEGPDSVYIGLSNRDLNVTIGPRGDGFTITWTTVIHPGEDAADQEVRRKTKTVDFAATGTAGVFKATNQADPMSGEDYAWARIDRQTLTVYLLTIDPFGVYNLQSYARTLTGFAMELEFRSIRDNRSLRVARGKLVKLEN